MNILVVNAGSSSHKLSLYSLLDDKPAAPLWKGFIDWGNASQNPSFKADNFKGFHLEEELKEKEPLKGIQRLLDTLWNGPCQVISGPAALDKVGHRVVHGGAVFEQPTQITAAVKEQIRKLIPLAPLHNPANLEGIELFERLFPSLIQIAVFDTTFHLTMPEAIKTYPLPKIWRDYGVQRYGFHGISHQYCAERAASLLKSSTLKIINCHLGNGCSLCAIDNGKSVATTMGFTPLEGLMMGTRSGSIDPGILLYLMREQGCTVQDLDNALNFESGLKGIAGAADMRMILARSDQEAQLALEMFVSRLKAFIGAMAAALGGVDALCFTAGIGENAAAVREAACRGLEFLQLKLDPDLNAACQPDQDVADVISKGRILVIHTEEEWMIARACLLI